MSFVNLLDMGNYMTATMKKQLTTYLLTLTINIFGQVEQYKNPIDLSLPQFLNQRS
jgi:hypothetical protein